VGETETIMMITMTNNNALHKFTNPAFCYNINVSSHNSTFARYINSAEV